VCEDLAHLRFGYVRVFGVSWKKLFGANVGFPSTPENWKSRPTEAFQATMTMLTVRRRKSVPVR
jgi:hypothetical protein